MKSLKLIVSVAAACLLLGASNAAMAVDCPNGSITDAIVDEIVINGQPCFIIGVRVRGTVNIANSPAIVMIENDVGFGIRVENSAFVGVVNNRLSGGSLDVRSSGQVEIVDNDVKKGSLRAIGNSNAQITRNDVGLNLVCANNTKQDAFFNHADGSDNCSRLGN